MNASDQPAPSRSSPRRATWTRADMRVIAGLAILHIGLAFLFVLNQAPGTDAALRGFPLDDAWIHMVYGRAIAEYGWPTYNPGTPEAGFTSPLWAIVCAVAHWLALASPLTAVAWLKVLGTISGALASVGAYRLTRLLAVPASHVPPLPGGRGSDRLAFGRIGFAASLLAAALTATTPVLAFSQVAGMEVNLAAACALWAICALAADRPLASGVWLAAAILTRPELAVLHVLALAFALGKHGADGVAGESPLRRAMKLFGPTALAGALWATYCVSVSGRPLPNTFYAKFATYPAGLTTVLTEMILPLPAVRYVGGALLYFFGAVRLLPGAASANRVTLTFPWAFLAALVLTRGIPPGAADAYYFTRYFAPALPLLCVPMGVGLSILAGGDNFQFVRNTSARRFVAAVLALAALGGAPQALKTSADLFAWNCQNIEEVQVQLGHWVAQNTPPDTKIVVNDAGALRYFSQRVTIDLLGLNFHSLALDPRRRLELCTQPAALNEFMSEQSASYLVVFPDMFTDLVGSPAGELLFEPGQTAKSEHYTVVREPRQARMTIFRLRGGGRADANARNQSGDRDEAVGAGGAVVSARRVDFDAASRPLPYGRGSDGRGPSTQMPAASPPLRSRFGPLAGRTRSRFGRGAGSASPGRQS
ncbi:MAG: hypothetical protein U1D55_04970 [Phycisphaerae bacterium]